MPKRRGIDEEDEDLVVDETEEKVIEVQVEKTEEIIDPDDTAPF